MATLILLGLSFLSPAARADTRGVYEGVHSTKDVVFIATTTPRVYASTRSYSGAVPSVGLYTSSNVVVSTSSAPDLCVIYATGTVACQRFEGSAAGLTGGISTSSTTWLTALAYGSGPVGSCVLGSTVTFTTTGGGLRLHFEGTVGRASGDTTQITKASVLIDSKYVDGTTSLVYSYYSGATIPANISFHYPVKTPPAAGSHTFCLVLALSGSGTGDIEGVAFAPFGVENIQ